MYELLVLQIKTKEPRTVVHKLLIPVTSSTMNITTVLINRNTFPNFDVCSFNYSFVVRAVNSEINSDPVDATYDYKGIKFVLDKTVVATLGRV